MVEYFCLKKISEKIIKLAKKALNKDKTGDTWEILSQKIFVKNCTNSYFSDFTKQHNAMKERRDLKKAEKAAKKRMKGEITDDDKTAKRVKKSIIVPQRLENSTINSKLNTITGTGLKIKNLE